VDRLLLYMATTLAAAGVVAFLGSPPEVATPILLDQGDTERSKRIER
jgi:hypothetical protein